jgi:hypothetical protein
MTTWTNTHTDEERYGRFGTFNLPTPTPTPTSCTSNPSYTVQHLSGGLVDGPDRHSINMACNNCTTPISLTTGFIFPFYDQTFTSNDPLIVGSNGTLVLSTNHVSIPTTAHT